GLDAIHCIDLGKRSEISEELKNAEITDSGGFIVELKDVPRHEIGCRDNPRGLCECVRYYGLPRSSGWAVKLGEKGKRLGQDDDRIGRAGGIIRKPEDYAGQYLIRDRVGDVEQK